MPSKFKSPYASSFNSAIKRGTPAFVAITNIAKRNNKSTDAVGNSLWKAGHCFRQKFNGQWVFWASTAPKKSVSNAKASQTQQWQWFVDWAISSGFCKPELLNKNSSSQKEFMSYCKKYFSKQFSSTTTSSKSKKSSSSKRSSSKSSYKFPKTKSRYGKKTYRKAA